MIDILIPVLGRPHNAATVAHSIQENTSNPHRILFVCSPGDAAQIEACQQVAATVVVDWQPAGGDYARKINHGFTVTGQPWVFQAADDLRFYPGWDTEAITAANRRGRMVVGTNDLHNPAVKKRRHATHILFRRDYITRYGTGTHDGSGIVMCELYDHQFVDTEMVETAMVRREWVFADRSIVEHLHPYWRLSDWDATYTKAMRDSQGDLDLYKQRSLAWAARRNEERRARAAAERERRRSASR